MQPVSGEGGGEASGERLRPWEEGMVRKRTEAGLSFLILKILTFTRDNETELYKKEYIYTCSLVHITS